jgi:WD40 repeat protein
MRFNAAAALVFLSGAAVLLLSDQTDVNAQAKQPAKVSAEEISRLVDQLGDNAFAKRDQARRKLEAIGEPAIAALQKAAESADDFEIRKAAQAIIRTYETNISGLVHIFGGHGNRVNGVAISDDGKRALSASYDGGLRYWDLEKKSLIRLMTGHRGAVQSVALSPDGKLALTGSGRGDFTMRLWNLDTGEEVRVLPAHPDTVWDVAFSPDGKQALSGCSDGKTRLWDLETGKERLALGTQNRGFAWTAAFLPDGRRAIAGGGNVIFQKKDDADRPSLGLWDLTTGKEIRSFIGHKKDVRSVAISRDGTQFLSGSFDGTMRLWDIETGKELKQFPGPKHFVEAVRFTPDGKKAICSYGPQVVKLNDDEDPTCALRLWDIASGKELRQFRGHDGPILSLAISADGRSLVSGSADRSMRLWTLSP